MSLCFTRVNDGVDVGVAGVVDYVLPVRNVIVVPCFPNLFMIGQKLT